MKFTLIIFKLVEVCANIVRFQSKVCFFMDLRGPLASFYYCGSIILGAAQLVTVNVEPAVNSQPGLRRDTCRAERQNTNRTINKNKQPSEWTTKQANTTQTSERNAIMPTNKHNQTVQS